MSRRRRRHQHTASRRLGVRDRRRRPINPIAAAAASRPVGSGTAVISIALSGWSRNLSKLWREIRTKTDEVSAPALVYEDLNSILRAIRDWVNEDIDRIIVDSRYYYNELMAFSERFMPQLAEIIELYQGDIPVFDAYGISGELHRSLERRVWLKSGGYIVIDEAEALVVIDVNTGKFVGKKDLEDTILKTNLEAVREIAHQLRIRNCGGIIIIDFIDMEKESHREKVLDALAEELQRDRARTNIVSMSQLGLVEMTRKRIRPSLIKTLCEPCSYCEGKGYIKRKSTIANEIFRELERDAGILENKKTNIVVHCHAEVVDWIYEMEGESLEHVEKKLGRSMAFKIEPNYHIEQYEIFFV